MKTALARSLDRYASPLTIPSHPPPFALFHLPCARSLLRKNRSGAAPSLTPSHVLIRVRPFCAHRSSFVAHLRSESGPSTRSVFSRLTVRPLFKHTNSLPCPISACAILSHRNVRYFLTLRAFSLSSFAAPRLATGTRKGSAPPKPLLSAPLRSKGRRPNFS